MSSKISTSLQILCSPYFLQAGSLHPTEMLLVIYMMSIDESCGKGVTIPRRYLNPGCYCFFLIGSHILN